MKTKIYYSVQNGGDGSAYPKFLPSEELAKWDQENMDEGWGELCFGHLEIESESEIFVKNVVSIEEYLFELIDSNWDGDMEDKIKKFITKFIPTKPSISYTTEVCNTSKGYYYLLLKLNNSIVRVFTRKTESPEDVIKKIEVFY